MRRRPPLLPLYPLLAAACVSLVVPTTAESASPVAASPVATAESVAREALLDALAPALAARGATASVSIAPPDARRELAPCAALTGFLPPGARLVGRTVVGVRCMETAGSAGWQTFVAADVRVDAPVWQAARALHAGEPLSAADVVASTAPLAAVDLDVAAGAGRAANARGLAALDGRLPAPVGRIVQRPVGAGRALTAADVRDEGRVNPGDTVRVVYLGDGFTVASEGRTVGAADPGAPVQIRLASGAVVAGTLRADRLVELAR